MLTAQHFWSQCIQFFLPYITTPTRLATHSKTLIDSIFSNNIVDGLISGNIISTTSDHFAQYLLQKDLKIDKSKSNLFQHNFKNLNIANTFNNFFVDVSKQIDSNMVKTHNKYQDCLLNPVVNTFHLDPTNTEEV